MVFFDILEFVWISSIFFFLENIVVEYYLVVEVNSGKFQVCFIVAFEGYFWFKVDVLQFVFGLEFCEICLGEVVVFENLMIGVYDSICWYFLGGQLVILMVEMLIVIYQEGGSYVVELIVYKGSIVDILV